MQALATGAPDCRWTERVAALTPEPLSDSLQATLTLVELWLVAPVGDVKVTTGAVVSTRTVPEVAWTAALPALSEMFASHW